jgi:potassium channel subfamily K, other eukaryote
LSFFPKPRFFVSYIFQIVISEAFETRYESIVRSHIFAKAIRRYKERAKTMTDDTVTHRTPLAASVLAHHGDDTNHAMKAIPSRVPTPKLPPTPPEAEDGSPERPKLGVFSRRNLTPSQTLFDTQFRTKAHLEGLPHKILHHAKSFHDRIHYFFGPESAGSGETRGDEPDWLKKLMDEIAGVDMINARMKREILSDQDARRVSTHFDFLSSFRE